VLNLNDIRGRNIDSNTAFAPIAHLYTSNAVVPRPNRGLAYRMMDPSLDASRVNPELHNSRSSNGF
jgi:hypothetical protein